MFTIGMSIGAAVFVVTVGYFMISNVRFNRRPKMYSSGYEVPTDTASTND